MSEDSAIFESAVRAAGDLAGVFEYDGETAYFYLYRTGDDPKVLGAIHVWSGATHIVSEDIVVRWSEEMNTVQLFVRGHFRAGFAADGTKLAVP
jgi:hypothetical protein